MEDSQSDHETISQKTLPNDIADADTSEVVCERCEALSRALSFGIKSSKLPSLQHLLVRESIPTLKNSDCKICKLLGGVKNHDGHSELLYLPAQNKGQLKGQLHLTQLDTPTQIEDFPYIGVLDNRSGIADVPAACDKFVDYDIMRGWFQESSRWAEKRSVPGKIRLINQLSVIDCVERAVQSAPPGCTYTALSYVWGPPSEVEVVKFPNLPSEIPQTIEDAMIVTKELGLRYLWVDRYCIDPNDATQKTTRTQQMGTTYSNATVTIVAAAGDDPNHGLAGVSCSRKYGQQENKAIDSVFLFDALSPVFKSVRESTWGQRAWTFQETFLSRGNLIFTSDGLLYISGAGTRMDNHAEYTLGMGSWPHRFGVHFRTGLYPTHTMDPSQFSTFIRPVESLASMIKELNGRKLTHQEDALNAIIGLFHSFSTLQDTPVYHMWGVPIAHFKRPRFSIYAFNLNWQQKSPGIRRPGFPSWSSFGWIMEFGGKPQLDLEMVRIPFCFKVHIKCKGHRRKNSLRSYIENGLILQHSGQKDAPRELHIKNGVTFTFGLGTDYEFGTVAILKTDNKASRKMNMDITIHCRIHWDDRDNLPIPRTNIRYTALNTRAPTGTFALVLSTTDGVHYERIGLMNISMRSEDWTLYNSKTGEQITNREEVAKKVLHSWTFVESKKRSLILV